MSTREPRTHVLVLALLCGAACPAPADGDAPADAASTGDEPQAGSTGASTGEGVDGDTTSSGNDAGCVVDGIELALGDSVTVYDSELVRIDDTCEQHAQVRTCTEQGLDGDPAFEFAECAVSTELHVHVQTRGDDRHDGLSEASPVRTLGRAIAIVDAFAEQATVSRVTIGTGRFEHAGELQLRHAVEIEGAGRDATVLAFAIDRDQASIRILTSNVVLEDVEIEVDLVESLNDGIHTGGRGEYGTALTLGRYLHTEPHEIVDGVEVRRIRIRRTNFTAAGITIIGRASNVEIDDVELAGSRTSTAVIVHWGGHSTVAPAPAAIEDPRYAVLTSYHPHALSIRDFVAEDTARLAVVSSAYDVELSNFEGPTSAMLFVLPGDEIDRFASPQDAGHVMTNLEFTGFRAPLIADEGEHVVRITSVGTSRMDGQRRLLENHGLRLEGFEVQGVEHPAGLSYRYGVNANDLRGSNIELIDIDLGDVASWEYDDAGSVQASFGVYLRDALGVSVSGLASKARYGLGIIDSQDISVDGATLTYEDNPPSAANAFGVYVAEGESPERANANLALSNSTITGYDYGVRYLDNPGGSKTGCDTLELEAVEFVDVGQETLCVTP